MKVPASEVFPVDCDWSDAELATIPCAYGTAENMLHRAALRAGERVLITGASGGVGSAAIQLARRRGARIVAVTSRDKIAAMLALGCETVLERDQDPITVLGEGSVDLIVDNVAGPQFSVMPKLLRRGGRYALRSHWRTARELRHARLLSQGSDLDRMHRLGRTGVP